jgi:outer membrane protein TolC
VERQRAVVSERVHAYQAAVLAALGEVEDALVQEARQAELVASLDLQLELSTQVLDRVRQAYAAGMVDYLRVLDAEQTQQGLERRRLAAGRELIELRIGLCRALAGGWAMKRPV